MGKVDWIRLIKDFQSSDDSVGNFCRVVQLWTDKGDLPLVASLSITEEVRIEGGDNRPFHDFPRNYFDGSEWAKSEWAFSDTLDLQTSPILRTDDYLLMEDEKLKILLIEKIDWSEFRVTLNKWCVYFDNSKDLDREHNDVCYSPQGGDYGLKKLVDNEIVSCDVRIESDFSFDSLISNVLKIEDGFWNSRDNDESGIYALIEAESQFAPFSYDFSDDTVDYTTLYRPNFSVRLSNIIEIISDEFAVTGAGYYPTRFDGQWPFYSVEFSAGYTTKPSQHEKMEALLELKRWLLSVDISEQDAELLLADKLPKGWLSQQPKIKW